MNRQLRYCQSISKDARRKIISLLLKELPSKRELARILSISPAAVIKYERGLTHPSDEVICKALEAAISLGAAEELKRILIEDLVETLRASLQWLLDEGLLEQGHLNSIFDLTARYKLQLLGAGPRKPVARSL